MTGRTIEGVFRGWIWNRSRCAG